MNRATQLNLITVAAIACSCREPTLLSDLQAKAIAFSGQVGSRLPAGFGASLVWDFGPQPYHYDPDLDPDEAPNPCKHLGLTTEATVDGVKLYSTGNEWVTHFEGQTWCDGNEWYARPDATASIVSGGRLTTGLKLADDSGKAVCDSVGLFKPRAFELLSPTTATIRPGDDVLITWLELSDTVRSVDVHLCGQPALDDPCPGGLCHWDVCRGDGVFLAGGSDDPADPGRLTIDGHQLRFTVPDTPPRAGFLFLEVTIQAQILAMSKNLVSCEAYATVGVEQPMEIVE